jgi:cytochrome b6-f complex iron-sulfur subunit
MTRKAFLKFLGISCLGGIGLSTIIESCGSINYFAKSTIHENIIQIPLSEFIYFEKEKQLFRKFVLIKPSQINFPICVFRISEKEYSAVLMECTHNSCELHNQGDFLSCPCHGSEFNSKGIVQNPPAEQNLKTYKTIINNEQINVEL